jgi:NADH pyrophosphatase NudC (nudix superfamily)
VSDFKWCPRCGKALVDEDLAGRMRRACVDDGCGYVFYDNPTPVVAALVENGDSVILVRNHGWPEHWFGLVTGFLERGESAEDGALREVREEIGLSGRVVRLIGVYPFFEMNQILIAYHVVADGEVVLGEEIAAAKRVLPERLRPWPGGTGLAVADWLSARSAKT